jgi:uncharacterized membrane protein YfcA
MDHPLLLFAAGLIAGTMNAVAGGGSFVTLPALVFAGVPSVPANASSTVALFPASFASAWAYRHDYRAFPQVSFKAMLAASLCGGLVGAILLLSTPSRRFDAILPWLLLAGSLAFAFGAKVGDLMRDHFTPGPLAMLGVQSLIGLYAGYYGGAAGLMMLAAWGLFGLRDLKAMNATRTLLVGSANAVAVLCFAVAGTVWWPQALLMLVAAVIGGYGGARLARRLDPAKTRAVITVFNFGMTAEFFWRAYA